MYLFYLLCARNVQNSADCKVSRDVGIVRTFNGTLEGQRRLLKPLQVSISRALALPRHITHRLQTSSPLLSPPPYPQPSTGLQINRSLYDTAQLCPRKTLSAFCHSHLMLVLACPGIQKALNGDRTRVQQLGQTYILNTFFAIFYRLALCHKWILFKKQFRLH